MPDIQIIYEFY